jgi:UPF0271 protein
MKHLILLLLITKPRKDCYSNRKIIFTNYRRPVISKYKHYFMLLCDLNCDLGEGIGNDHLIIPFITSANIACGYHAGDRDTMERTVALCKEHHVNIGAHPSFNDRVNFGRKERELSPMKIEDLVQQQVLILKGITEAAGCKLHHVKPHGALYNTAARDPMVAAAIAKAVKNISSGLVLFGLSGSHLISAARAVGLSTMSEVFADRTYMDDGSLTPRSVVNALITDEQMAIEQVMQMVKKGTVTSTSGKQVPIVAETICIHGDGSHAVAFAQQLHEQLTIK